MRFKVEQIINGVVTPFDDFDSNVAVCYGVMALGGKLTKWSDAARELLRRHLANLEIEPVGTIINVGNSYTITKVE